MFGNNCSFNRSWNTTRYSLNVRLTLYNLILFICEEDSASTQHAQSPQIKSVACLAGLEQTVRAVWSLSIANLETVLYMGLERVWIRERLKVTFCDLLDYIHTASARNLLFFLPTLTGHRTESVHSNKRKRSKRLWVSAGKFHETSRSDENLLLPDFSSCVRPSTRHCDESGAGDNPQPRRAFPYRISIS